jgi:hypothetical protein
LALFALAIVICFKEATPPAPTGVGDDFLSGQGIRRI